MFSAWVAVADTPVSVADAAADQIPFVYVNSAFEAVSGYPAAEVVGRTGRFLEAATDDPDVAPAVQQVLQTGRPTRSRVLNQRADGTTWWSEVHLAPVRDAAGRISHIVGLQLDITDQMTAEQQTVHAATHDPLTGLVTRAHFIDQLQRELSRAARDHTGLAVLFLDVDHLKAVNDTHGHAAGDALLVEIAADAAQAAATTTRVVDELRTTLSGPVTTGRTSLSVSVSIGTALYPRDGTSPLELLARADTTMYRQKHGH